MINLFLADDHKIFRDCLRPVITKESGCDVIGEASDGLETLRKVRELHPDVVIMDISMPTMNGIEATRKIKEEFPEIHVIILSMHSDRRYIIEALKSGAMGYLLKESALEDLLQAVREVIAGKLFVSPTVSGIIINDYLKLTKQDESSAFSILSQREREVLQLLAEGTSTRNIADKLNLSVKTIESHRKQIMDKLDIHTVAELTKYAIREGLTSL